MERDRVITHHIADQECKPLPGWVCICVGIMFPVAIGLLLLAVRFLSAS